MEIRLVMRRSSALVTYSAFDSQVHMHLVCKTAQSIAFRLVHLPPTHASESGSLGIGCCSAVQSRPSCVTETCVV